MTEERDVTEAAKQLYAKIRPLILEHIKPKNEPPEYATGIIIISFKDRKWITISTLGEVAYEIAAIRLYDLAQLNKQQQQQGCETCG